MHNSKSKEFSEDDQSVSQRIKKLVKKKYNFADIHGKLIDIQKLSQKFIYPRLDSLTSASLKRTQDYLISTIAQIGIHVEELKDELNDAFNIGITQIIKWQEFEKENERLKKDITKLENEKKQDDLSNSNQRIMINEQKNQIKTQKRLINSIEAHLVETRKRFDQSLKNERSLNSKYTSLQSKLSENKTREEYQRKEIKRISEENKKLQKLVDSNPSLKKRIKKLEAELAVRPAEKDLSVSKMNVQNRILRGVVYVCEQIEKENQKIVNQSNIKEKDIRGLLLTDIIDRLYAELGEPNFRRIEADTKDAESSLQRTQLLIKDYLEKKAAKPRIGKIGDDIDELGKMVKRIKLDFNDLKNENSRVRGLCE